MIGYVFEVFSTNWTHVTSVCMDVMVFQVVNVVEDLVADRTDESFSIWFPAF